jgi:ABC-type glycerol-3-phosphate transport system permease component
MQGDVSAKRQNSQGSVRSALVGLVASLKTQRTLTGAFTHALLLIGVTIIFVPLAWTVSTSLKPAQDVFLYPPKWIPDPIQWENYREALTIEPFHLYFLNSFVIAVSGVIGRLFSSSIVAYSFARLRWKGRDIVFMVMLSTLMLPSQVTLIPQFILYKLFGWLNTFKPLIVPMFFGGPFFIFLLRQFYMTIPAELDDAARIDGCSSFGIFWRMILPLSGPALAAVAILVFQWRWNDFFGPLIYLHDKSKFPVPVGLLYFQNEWGGMYWPLLMAASLVCMLPIVLLFFLAQRYFIQGIVFTGVKG